MAHHGESHPADGADHLCDARSSDWGTGVLLLALVPQGPSVSVKMSF